MSHTLTTIIHGGTWLGSSNRSVVGLLGGKLAEHLDLVKSSSPVICITPDDAPFQILHATKDLCRF